MSKVTNELYSLRKGDIVVFAGQTNYEIFPISKVLLRVEDCVLVSDCDDLSMADHWWTIESMVERGCIKQNSKEDIINRYYRD